MSTTTTIELVSPAARSQQQLRPSRRDGAAPDDRDNGNPAEEDPVLAASRVADSTVPDGGYGWVVVAAGAVLMWWAVGTTYSWGVMQEGLVARGGGGDHDGSKELSSSSGTGGVTALAFVGSLSATLVAVLGVVNSRILRLLGARRAALSAVGFVGVSEILSSFATRNLGALFFTAGILLGVGVSMSFMVVTSMAPQYFSKKRGLANGIIFAGGGFGGAAMCFALEAIIRNANVAWAFRVQGAMTLATGLPAAWFIKERVPLHTNIFVDWRLFKSITFIFVFLAGAIGTFPLLVPPFFLPSYCTSLGMSSTTGAGLVAGFNLASAVGRIGSGLLCDRIGSLNTLFIAFMLTALSMLVIWPVSTTLGPMIIFVLVNGASNGGFFSTMPTVVADVFGSARVSTAMGMVVSGWAGGYLFGAPIAGYLLQAYGGTEKGFTAYRPALFYAGSMALGAAGLVAAVRLRKRPGLWSKV